MKYTIIITTYNKEQYIKRCLDSIINQTIKNFKTIIIDDGSTDNTKKIIKPYLKDKNIEYYYKKNSGVADSRNFGVNQVTTDYFLFIDSDDYIDLKLFETIDKYKNYDLLSFKSIKVDESGKFIKKLEKGSFKLTTGKDYLEDLMVNHHFFLVPWGYIYNTKFWKKHNFEYPKHYVMEDAGRTPIIILNAKKVISIDYYGYYYVQTNESIIRTNCDDKIILKTKSLLFHYDNLIKYLNNQHYDEEFNIIFNDYFAKWLLWYGSTLKNKYLKNYEKEMKKRNVADKLKIKFPRTRIKVFICKTSYIFYFKMYNLMCKKEDK